MWEASSSPTSTAARVGRRPAAASRSTSSASSARIAAATALPSSTLAAIGIPPLVVVGHGGHHFTIVSTYVPTGAGPTRDSAPASRFYAVSPARPGLTSAPRAFFVSQPLWATCSASLAFTQPQAEHVLDDG